MDKATKQPLLVKFTFQYASIKPISRGMNVEIYNEFTFQYASIKPIMEIYLDSHQLDLHFNMLLLNRVLISIPFIL